MDRSCNCGHFGLCMFFGNIIFFIKTSWNVGFLVFPMVFCSNGCKILSIRGKNGKSGGKNNQWNNNNHQWNNNNPQNGTQNAQQQQQQVQAKSQPTNNASSSDHAGGAEQHMQELHLSNWQRELDLE